MYLAFDFVAFVHQAPDFMTLRRDSSRAEDGASKMKLSPSRLSTADVNIITCHWAMRTVMKVVLEIAEEGELLMTLTAVR
jgi:hypothetical protein